MKPLLPMCSDKIVKILEDITDISEELQACLGDVSPLTITVHCKKKKIFS